MLKHPTPNVQTICIKCTKIHQFSNYSKMVLKCPNYSQKCSTEVHTKYKVMVGDTALVQEQIMIMVLVKAIGEKNKIVIGCK